MAVKALPCGLKEFAVFVGIARGEGDITFKAFQSQLKHNAFAGVHLGHVGDVVPFDFKILVEDAAWQAVGYVVFVINVSTFRAQAGAKLLVVTVERRAETVVMAKGFSVRVFEAEIGGQDFAPDVATDIKDAETRSTPQGAFTDIGHGIRLTLPAAFFQDCLDGGNKRHGQKKAVEKLLPLSFTGGKGLGGQGGEEIDFRAHGGSR